MHRWKLAGVSEAIRTQRTLAVLAHRCHHRLHAAQRERQKKGGGASARRTTCRRPMLWPGDAGGHRAHSGISPCCASGHVLRWRHTGDAVVCCCVRLQRMNPAPTSRRAPRSHGSWLSHAACISAPSYYIQRTYTSKRLPKKVGRHVASP